MALHDSVMRTIDPSPLHSMEIRNQAVCDPTPDEIRERSAEVRQTWNETRWRKETRRLRCRRWTVPEVHVLPALLDSTSA